MATSQRTRRKTPTPADTSAAAPVMAAALARDAAAATRPATAAATPAAAPTDPVASGQRGRVRQPKAASVAALPVRTAVARPVDAPATKARSPLAHAPVQPAAGSAARAAKAGRTQALAAPTKTAQAKPAKAVQAAPVKTAQAKLAKAAQAAPAKAAQAKLARTAQAAPAKAARAAPAKTAQAAPTKVAQATPVKVAQVAQTKTAQAAPAKTAQAKPAKVAQVAPTKTAQAVPAKAAQAAPAKTAPPAFVAAKTAGAPSRRTRPARSARPVEPVVLVTARRAPAVPVMAAEPVAAALVAAPAPAPAAQATPRRLAAGQPSTPLAAAKPRAASRRTASTPTPAAVAPTPTPAAAAAAATPTPTPTPARGMTTDDTVQAVLAVLASTPAAAVPMPPAAPAALVVAPAPPRTPAAPAAETPSAPHAAPRAAAPGAAARAARPAAPPAAPPAAAAIKPAAEPRSGPAHSEIVLIEGDHRRIAWRPGHACPPALRQAALQRLDGAGQLAPDDDAALPTLLRLAAEAHHPLRVDEAVWAHLAAHRDARTRLHTLEAAYPGGPADPALAGLLRSPLPLFQAEGALFAVVAGRALIADERGLGKGVQAIAAARLWQRHFGVQRVLVLCAADQRAAWRRAWLRFAGVADGETPQLMDGGLHQRQALWSTAAAVRILSPEALDSDAAHLAQWAPDLVIVDEPQRLGLRDTAWAQLAAPQALVLCGAALAEQPALMQAIVGWLDHQRLGPLAALHELQTASEAGNGLDDAAIERLTTQLSRLMLQRLRADVADQLPPLVHTERLLTMAPGQREAHDRHLVQARRIVDGWQRSGYLSDDQQWTLSVALREMQRAAHRADPADALSALADSTLQALAAQLADWADQTDSGTPRVALLCPDEADLAPLAQRLAERGALAATDDAGQPLVQLVAPGAALPAAVDVVLQVGVPWRGRRSPAGARDEAPAGQQWVYLVASDSLDTGLFDTLAQRHDAPRGLADGGGRAYLQGERLADWMRAVQAALLATDAGR